MKGTAALLVPIKELDTIFHDTMKGIAALLMPSLDTIFSNTCASIFNDTKGTVRHRALDTILTNTFGHWYQIL